MPDLLIELFSEEIPARMQARAADDLKKLITNGLVEAGLTYASAGAFATPRRLCLTIDGLTAESPTTREERKGPRADAPEQALAGFLRATGLQRGQLEERTDKKGNTVLFAVIERPGRPAAEIIAEVLEHTIRTFPWPKSMRWGAGTLRWVRPLHRILCVLSSEGGAEVVPLEVEGIAASNLTEGHRFLAPAEIEVSGFEDYVTKLKRAKVILDPAERADTIWHDAQQQAFAAGLELVEDKGLLAEVAGLVEWPVVLMGEIGADFLHLPAEVLQTSMKEHQKFFSVRDPKTGGIVRFVTVANRETADHGATILAGNQKVLSARLADARFFWDNDLRVAKDQKMEPWLAALENVTFHNKLGSQKDLIDRIAGLAGTLAPTVGADAEMAGQAARVAKADLASEMVYEFPELQGIMGKYYAQAAGLPAEVANAVEEHYAPLGPSDAVPTAPVSVAVSLAEKIDKLAGFWAINEKPTGSKDPFALRRAALGVIRIVLENDLRLGLNAAVAAAGDQIGPRDQGDGVQGHAETADVVTFIHERLKVFLRNDGVRHDVIDACLALPGNDDLWLVVARARALGAVLATEDGENLVQGFKRANNILAQAEKADGVAYEYGPDRKYAEDAAEVALFDALDNADAAILAALEGEDFATAMGAMAALRTPIDAFFEAVQVNADNEIVRRNRLNLLHRIRETCLKAADLSKVEG
ncbi:MAG: glycine--tRNA ligase subunit beta [Oceanicola sp.]|nr:glycine--tRNA ligase subunit beta [Oceanicola sp.]